MSDNQFDTSTLDSDVVTAAGTSATFADTPLCLQIIELKRMTRGMGNDSLSEIELVENLKNSGSAQEDAMRILHGRHYPSVIAVLARFSFDQDTIEDLAQDTFINAFENIESFGGRSSFRTWLCKIAFNLAIDKTREAYYRLVDVNSDELTSIIDQLNR